MTREEALMELSKPAYDKDEMKQDFEFVAKKLNLNVDELR